MNRFTSALLCGCALPALLIQAAYGDPRGGVVTQGAAMVSTNGGALTVDQKTKIVIINWDSFNIAKGESARFNQPGSDATAVNRIGGTDPAQILGSLSANGRVILIDGNGIVFGPNAKVNVGSLIATTSDAADADLMAGKANFNKPGNPNARIVNQGSITAAAGGMVGLIAPGVSNEGTIRARLGQVNLAGANVFTLDFTGDGLVSFPVDPSVMAAALDASGQKVKALVANKGRIEGATVTLTARAAAGLVENAISMNGKIVATAAHQVGGRIVLDAGQGSIALKGATLDASGAKGGGTVTVGSWDASSISADAQAIIKANANTSGNGGSVSIIAQNTQYAGSIEAEGGSQSGNGGKVETSGHHADLNHARVTTAAAHGNAGNWLIDPTDFTVAASGGDMTGAQLTANLANGDVTILSSNGATGTSGNININDVVSWSSHTLTLDAYNDINVNAVMSATGTAHFNGITGDTGGNGISTTVIGTSDTGYLNMGLNDGGFYGRLDLAATAGFVLNGNNYAIVTTLGTQANPLPGISYGYAVLGADIDAAPAAAWSTVAYAGFQPLVYSTFQLDGLGHSIRNLAISENPQSSSILGVAFSVGLFRDLTNAYIANFGIASGDIYGGQQFSQPASLAGGTGALFGTATASVFRNVYSKANVTGYDEVGGLGGVLAIQDNPDLTPYTVIENSFVAGTVTFLGSSQYYLNNRAPAYAGGLLGLVYVNNAILNANVTIDKAHFTGNLVISNVDTTLDTGGLIGYAAIGGDPCCNFGMLTISNSYATGRWSQPGYSISYNNVLVGQASYTNIIRSYALGGLVYGLDHSLIQDSYTASNAALFNSSYSVSGNTIQDSYDINTPFNPSSYDPSIWIYMPGVGQMLAWEKPVQTGAGFASINTTHQLQLIGLDSTSLSQSYVLASDLSLSGISFAPLGSAATPFTGSLDGGGHALSGLSLNLSGNAGLFGTAGAGSSISNLALTGFSITGSGAAGALAGTDAGSIRNVYVTGTVNGAAQAGGLVGVADGASITDVYSAAAVYGAAISGGLVGQALNGATITNGYFDSDRSGMSAAIGSGTGGGAALTTAQLRSGVLPTGFDSAWRAAAGFDPYLQGQGAISYTATSITLDAAQSAGAASILDGGHNLTLTTTALQGAFGDITINGAMSWSAGSLLTLNSTTYHNININAPITVNGLGRVSLMTGKGQQGNLYADNSVHDYGDYVFGHQGSLSFLGQPGYGHTGRLLINNNPYFLVSTMADLTTIANLSVTEASIDLMPSHTQLIALATNIDASGTVYDDAHPLGLPLTGIVTGLGHVIDGLTEHFTTTHQQNGGLFYAAPEYFSTYYAAVRDMGLTNVSFSGPDYFGAFGGYFPTIAPGTGVVLTNLWSTGSISGLGAGGLVYGVQQGSVTNSWSSATVTATASGGYAGGLVGILDVPTDLGLSMNSSFSTGTVTSLNGIAGGLVGFWRANGGGP